MFFDVLFLFAVFRFFSGAQNALSTPVDRPVFEFIDHLHNIVIHIVSPRCYTLIVINYNKFICDTIYFTVQYCREKTI